ncbi:hypothetical protein Dda_7812 [Drechslerella dactyloides]|uniref:Uncharacterized protein n=1 Tax=Drechslerella dactyloides TaxID=74499 RepID=A0AAD6NG51_DREDA|nr:hypothetical protein Dda_7812 [Drechslerella dactyloides]
MPLACTDQEVVNVCLAWYSCFCIAGLGDKMKTKDRDRYREDGPIAVMEKIRASHGPFRAAKAPGLHPSPIEVAAFKSPSAKLQYSPGEHENMVYGTLEPYYVEGPSRERSSLNLGAGRRILEAIEFMGVSVAPMGRT